MGWAAASPKPEPASSISHTLVTGGSVLALPLPAGVGVGEGVASAGALVSELGAVVLAGSCVAATLLCLRRCLAGAGVAVSATGGGCTLAAPVVLWRAAAPTPSIRSSTGNGRPDDPAKEALGAGPIAAPTATPIASITAASAAVTRGEGASRGGLPAREGDSRLPRVGFGSSWEDFRSSGGDFGCSGVLSMVSEVPDFSNKIANLDQVYRDMLLSPSADVNYLSTDLKRSIFQ